MASSVRRIYLATGNAHKVREFQQLAAATGTPVEFVRPESMPAVVEDTGTFIGNARKKALALKAILPAEAWVLADDSGLCVDALGGAPGVESAYYAGPEGDSAANLAKLVQDLRKVPTAQRGAHFLCVLVLIDEGGYEHVFEGRCVGHLLLEPRGGSGFGYDPLFVPDGYEKSLAEFDEASKNLLSHRGRAWNLLRSSELKER
ncbi:MAG TPA: RdgB/HAM1 family non-canonical purine NTP pyrophosphatase [Lacunisphaera sp.]|jgi:XTP/dITP diphosphohydrolase